MATRIDLVEDVLPISELRLRAAQQIKKIQKTHRPLVITQYGKAVAVLMEVAQFQNWEDRLTHLEEHAATLEREVELLRGGRPQESDLDSGNTHSREHLGPQLRTGEGGARGRSGDDPAP